MGNPDAFAPIRFGQVELSEAPEGIGSSTTETEPAFGRASLVVRIHGSPLGLVDLPLRPGMPSPASSVQDAIDEQLGDRIRAHLVGDGLEPRPGRLGLPVPSPVEPACRGDIIAVLADPPRVSVVVPTVDRPAALRACLDGLRSQVYGDFEVVVVDNAPGTSGAAPVVAELAPSIPRLRLVEEPRHGASRARNRGVEAATGDVVAFLDGDVVPDRWWLAALVAALVTPLAGRGGATCATGLILPTDLETEPQLWLEEWGGYAKGFERREFDLARRREIGPLFPFAIAVCGSGASMAFRRSQLLALGGFDPALGPGTPSASGEDLALLLDTITAGGTIVYEPRAMVWHSHPATEAAFRSTLSRYGIGLTAYLARHLARHPADLVRLAAAMPAAIGYFLRPTSDRNRRRSDRFPRDVRGLEVRGMLRGPFAYALGRARLLRRGEVRRGGSPNRGPADT